MRTNMGALPTIFLFNSATPQRAATTIVSGAEATGEPLYANVPMPGKEVSGEPAIEGPAITKATARMKLRVRI
jgi:hypothetical protein